VDIYNFLENIYIKNIFQPLHGKYRFLQKIKKEKCKTLLDVGCGNNSPFYIKQQCPDIYYIGIDIGDYNQEKPNLADEYIITTPNNFSNTILNCKNMMGGVDVVISSHNLEHCNNRKETLTAITNVIKQKGILYLSFPSEKSVNFPGYRVGCLNYYDDSTHKEKPPIYKEVIQMLKENNMKIIFSSKSYKPLFSFLIGLLFEKRSKIKKAVAPGTWAYWGFETIIWARKL